MIQGQHASSALLPLCGCSAKRARVPSGSAGALCLGGAIGRFSGPGQVQVTSSTGGMSLDVDLGAMAQPTLYAVAPEPLP